MCHILGQILNAFPTGTGKKASKPKISLGNELVTEFYLSGRIGIVFLSGNWKAFCWLVGWYKGVLRLSEWYLEGGQKASPTFMIVAKN